MADTRWRYEIKLGILSESFYNRKSVSIRADGSSEHHLLGHSLGASNAFRSRGRGGVHCASLSADHEAHYRGRILHIVLDRAVFVVALYPQRAAASRVQRFNHDGHTGNLYLILQVARGAVPNARRSAMLDARWMTSAPTAPSMIDRAMGEPWDALCRRWLMWRTRLENADALVCS